MNDGELLYNEVRAMEGLIDKVLEQAETCETARAHLGIIKRYFFDYVDQINKGLDEIELKLKQKQEIPVPKEVPTTGWIQRKELSRDFLKNTIAVEQMVRSGR